MSELYIQQIASQNAQWLTQRAALIANNVANANTPGFRAHDVQPFASVLDHTEIAMTTTNSAHMLPATQDRGAAREVETPPSDETLSGNTVNLEQQMMNLGDINRAYTMNTNIKRAFHQMLLAALK